MKKRVFAFLTALLIFTGCLGSIGYAGASGEAAVLQPVTAMAAATGSNGSNGSNGTNGSNGSNGTAGAAQAPGTLLVVDDARLLSEEEEARLIADYSVITEYMGAALSVHIPRQVQPHTLQNNVPSSTSGMIQRSFF